MKIKWFSLVRVTGLCLVLVYHFFQTKFPGGFIGVDVFFTFSGYLVTALFIDEYFRDKQVDLISFARRRLYRIVPPLLMMILLVMPLTFLVKKDFVADIGHQLAATIGFSTNIYELLTGGNYESQFIPHLFLHTWSLSIEVQLYVFWGILVYWISRSRPKLGRFRSSLFVLSLLLFILSFGSLFIRTFLTEDFSSLYFSSTARSFSFFLGSAFAAQTGISNTTNRFKKNARLWKLPQTLFYILGCLSMLLLFAFLLEFNHQITYLFGLVLTSLFTGLMIYSTRILHEQTADVNEPLFLSSLADLSYGIYLFHWPLYVIFSQRMEQLMAIGLTLVLSSLLAFLSLKIIEPLLAGKKARLFGQNFGPPKNKWPFYSFLGGLVAILIWVSATAPAVGKFETDLLVNSLSQAQSNLNRTHTLAAGDVTAISDVVIIGDSVTLRASGAISTSLPEAQLDAAVSRSFVAAYEIFQNHIDNDSLAKTVVIAVGVNSVYNYQADIDQFVSNLPKGHRLILVTPYNVKDGRVPAVRDYEKDLAKKYPYITVADWYQTAVDNPDIWNNTDGVHFSDANNRGSELYAKTIKEAIAKAARKAAK